MGDPPEGLCLSKRSAALRFDGRPKPGAGPGVNRLTQGHRTGHGDSTNRIGREVQVADHGTSRVAAAKPLVESWWWGLTTISGPTPVPIA